MRGGRREDGGGGGGGGGDEGGGEQEVSELRLAEAKEMSGGLRQSDVMLVDMLQERPRSDLQEGHF